MKISKLLTDIRFWIIFFFIIRLYGITNPPLEVAHNWRQTTVTMVSRNFLETDNNIFYPRIDIAGEKTGITGMEFPLFNYMIYATSYLFGYQHWYGRLINLLVSSIGLWYFFKILRKYFTEKTALYASLILAVSIWFQFSRKIMPDTFSMSLILACIYYGTNYLENRNHRFDFLNLPAFAVLMTLGVLSKLPSGYLLIVFIPFLFNNEIAVSRKIIFLTVSIIGAIPVAWWYSYWVPHLVEKYGFWHFFMGKGFQQGISEIMDNIPQTLVRFYDTALKFTGFAAFVFGLIMALIKRERNIYLLFLLAFAGFCIFIFKAGFAFPHHSYYIIPFVPVMSLVAGYGLSRVSNSKVALIFLVVISVEGIANQQHDFRIPEVEMQLVNLESDLNNISGQNELILINSGQNPTPMYFAHRKGWVGTNEEIQDSLYVRELTIKGLKSIVILKRYLGTDTTLSGYKKVLENENYCIYSISDNSVNMTE